MRDLSILIPARNEIFLRQTIEDILSHIEGDTEIIAILDGAFANPYIDQHDRVTLVYHPTSIGQRAATNEAAKISTAKFVMKCDAHCSFDQGFDRKLMETFEPDWTVIPRMYNLYAFDWQCKNCGHRVYQGPYPTECIRYEGRGKNAKKIYMCDNTTDFEMQMVWKPRLGRENDYARIDNDLRFKYWGGYERRPGTDGQITDTMGQLGACWMMHRDRYWELGGLDEAHGSWGQMGVEVSCKSWLSGGRQVVNKSTWFAHMFRTRPGFKFPYPLSNSQVNNARRYSRWLWLEGNWLGAVHDFDWLLERFKPVPTWHQSRAAIYYTDCELDRSLMGVCQKQLHTATPEIPVIAVYRNKVITRFGKKRTKVDGERGPLTMFRQILAGLESIEVDVVYFTEHDVLYHPSHFAYQHTKPDRYYYNENVWKVRTSDGHALHYPCQQTSGLRANRELLIKHYKERIRRVEQEGHSNRMGYEPGTHNRPERIDDYKAESWMSEHPNIDLRHGGNLTPSRWRKDQFRNQKYTVGWTEAEEVPGWGRTKGRMKDFLSDLVDDNRNRVRREKGK